MSVISAFGLSKGYRQYQKPVDSLKELIFRKNYHDIIWALRDVSFSLQAGEQLGVIGNNGAGKSTLLKLLAGTTAATSGTLNVSGTRSAILELGSGFHPDFSGYENARIGCALQGLDDAQIDALIPSIAEFSELGDAIHRTVKTYSSGMYVRLAFSVATAVEPDLLIVDEALSVGDQHFQKKSLDRMRSYIDQDKTLVFCSHNLYQVKSLCKQVLWLKQGKQMMLGDAAEVVDAYQDHIRAVEESTAKPIKAVATEQKPAEIISAELSTSTTDGGHDFHYGERLVLKVKVFAKSLTHNNLSLAVVIVRNDEVHVYGTSTEIEDVELEAISPSQFGKTLIFKRLQLLSGSYRFYIYLLDETGIHIYDMRESVLPFTVRHSTREVGVARLDHHWDQP